MSSQTTAGVGPLGANRSAYTLMMVLLSVSMIAVVTIPLLIPVMIYVSKLRRQAVQAHEAWDVARNRGLWIESEVRRLGVMSHVQRQDDLSALGEQVRRAQTQLDAKSREMAALISAKERQMAALIAAQEEKRTGVERQVSARQVEVEELTAKILDLKDIHDVQDFGLYDFENPAEDSVRLGGELTRVQTRIKAVVKDKSATEAASGWTVNNSAAKGRNMVNDMSKLLLRAYNAEAENAIKTVKAGHLTAAVKRLDRSAEAVARLGKMMSIRITPEYAGLRRHELELTHQHLEAVKAAKDEEREIRRQEREEAKAQREFTALKAKQEKEVEHYRNVVASLNASGKADEALKMTATLEDAEDKLADVERTMANTRAGYVYVASNRGAFGERVVKIGMTRRLNPDDRIRELSDASVPFNFDKHTIIFSQDAVGLENALHKHFEERRVNLINMRREYFYATPREVKDALVARDVQVLEFHEQSEAAEFEASELQRMDGQGTVEVARV